jgi:beta-lactamase class A
MPRYKILLISITLCLLLIIAYFSLDRHFNIKSEASTRLTPSVISFPSPSVIPITATKQKIGSLSASVQEALEGTKGSYGVVVKNIKSGESYYANEHTTYGPGSLYKLWVMATVYQQIQSGALQEDQVLSEDVTVLNTKFRIASESAEQTEGIISLSVADALNNMITISDNYSALLLAEKIRLSTVAAFLKDSGLSESTVGTDGSDPTTTPSDIALFFEKLYHNELANEQYTHEMIDLLKQQEKNNKLPKYLADDVVIAHKTGELDGYSHDAGIVYAPDGEYIIAVLSNSDNPPAAEDRIANISKNVYTYFTQ